MDENQNLASSSGGANNSIPESLGKENNQNEPFVSSNQTTQPVEVKTTAASPQGQQPTPVPVENLQSENKVGESFVAVNYVSQQANVSGDNNTLDRDKNQKIIFTLALLLFATSVLGLGLYLISGWKSGRLNLKKAVTPSLQTNQSDEAVIVPTPISFEKLTTNWASYRGDSFIVKYPPDLIPTNKSDLLVFSLAGEDNKTMLELKVLPVLSSEDLIEILVEEASKFNPVITYADIKNSFVDEKIGSRDLISYNPKVEGGPVFFVFKDPDTNKKVLILDYSRGEAGFENLVPGLTSSFEFLNPTNTPTSTPSAKFNVGE